MSVHISFATAPIQKGDLYLASSLCDGLEDNDLKQVTTLLTKKDADPNVLMPLHGVTPFHLIIGNSSEAFAEEVTKLFLRHGGNPNVRSVDGMTPVHVAAAWGRTTILELLLANGGDPLCLDDDYVSPIHYAFQGEHHDAVQVLYNYCITPDEDEIPKFKRELDKVLVNNGEVLAEYIVSDGSIFDSSINDSSLTNSTNRSSKVNTSDYMPESSTTNSVSVNNEFVTLRKKRKEITIDKMKTEEEERLIINKIIAQLSSSIASDMDSSTSILKDYEYDYSSNDISTLKKKRILMAFNRPKKNNECVKLSEKSTNNRRSSTLQVIEQHNHVSYLNNRVLKNNLKKAPNISEKNIVSNKSMRSLTKTQVTPNKFENSAFIQDNYSYMNKWLDETIISKSPNLIIDTRTREKKAKRPKTPTFEKRSSPIHTKISKKSSVVTSTNAKDKSPKHVHSGLTPISRIPRPTKYFTTPSHLRTVKRSIETPTKTVIPNKKKANPSEETSTSHKSNTIAPSNRTYSKFKSEENSEGSNRSQIIEYKKTNLKNIAMNLDHCKYDDNDEDFIDEANVNSIKHNVKSKSNDKCLSVFNKEFEKQLPKFNYISGIGMLDSTMTSRSNSKSGLNSNKENTLQYDSQAKKAFLDEAVIETLSKNKSMKENIKEEHEISQEFGISANAYSSLVCTIGSNLSVSSDSYQSLSKSDDVVVDHADDKCVDLKPPFISENNVYSKDSISNTFSKLDSKSFLSIEEEYKYEDSEEGIVLLEKRLCVSPPCASSDMNSSYFSCSTARSEPLPKELLMLDNTTLRGRLQNFGENPGPITETTYRLYLKRLHKLESSGEKPVHPNYTSIFDCKQLTDQLKSSLLSVEWIHNLDDYEANEQKIFSEFHKPNPSRKWREGATKCSFNYLLLDPRITEDLPRRAGTLGMSEKWKIFLSAIFYVGKGKHSRPYSHLYDAFKIWVSKDQHVTSKKIQRILDIWNEGRGVVVLHVFHNTIPVEAYTREAAMIEALGTQKLGNRKCGDYYGVVATWKSKEKCELGRYLLFKAFQIFLVEGERQIFPDNL